MTLPPKGPQHNFIGPLFCSWTKMALACRQIAASSSTRPGLFSWHSLIDQLCNPGHIHLSQSLVCSNEQLEMGFIGKLTLFCYHFLRCLHFHPITKTRVLSYSHHNTLYFKAMVLSLHCNSPRPLAWRANRCTQGFHGATNLWLEGLLKLRYVIHCGLGVFCRRFHGICLLELN